MLVDLKELKKKRDEGKFSVRFRKRWEDFERDGKKKREHCLS